MTTPDGHRRLCICADDYGMSAGINAAVLNLAERGRISATGCMVLRSAWKVGAQRLSTLSPLLLDTGLHLDLSHLPGHDGADSSLGRLIAACYLRVADRAWLRDQVRIQLSMFEDAMGRAPSFVDGHRHVHQLPVVRDILVHELSDRYAGQPPWLRSTAPDRAAHRPQKQDLIFALGGRALRRLAHQHGMQTNGRLLGVYGFDDAVPYRVLLGGWTDACADRDVLMCHPSLSRLPSDPIAEARCREYRALNAFDAAAYTAGGQPVVVMPLSHILRRTTD
ncbi:hypothetical protein BH10PSE18_BH10PSE18_17260 [soil metagenome]